jgi:hypothetical protein
MKVTLMIEGSASALAAILAMLPGDASVSVATPAAPAMPGIPPMPANPNGGDDGDDDTGPVAAVPDGAVDTAGLPWDERIHAKTKATIGDGTWRKKRGVDDATVAAVEAELRARSAPPMPAVAPPMPAVAPVAPPIMPPVAVAPPAPVVPPMPAVAAVAPPPPMPAPAPEPVQAAVAVAPPPPMPAPAPEPVQAAVAVATGTLDFAQFMQHLSGQMTKRDAAGAPLVHADYLAGITAEISQVFAPHGIPPLSAITDIATNPQLITYAVQLLQRDGRW